MSYFQQGTDVAGYSFNASNYCPTDMGRIALEDMYGVNWELAPRNLTIEDILSTWATKKGIDREDESSYDQADFPKVIFVSDTTDEDCCEACGEEL